MASGEIADSVTHLQHKQLSAQRLLAADGLDLVFAVFRESDTGNNGTLSCAELEHILTSLDPGQWTKRDIELLTAGISIDREGRFKYEELLASLASKAHLGSGSGEDQRLGGDDLPPSSCGEARPPFGNGHENSPPSCKSKGGAGPRLLGGKGKRGPPPPAFCKGIKGPLAGRNVDPAESSSNGAPGDPFRALSVKFITDDFLNIFGADVNQELTVRDIEPHLRRLSGGVCPRDGREGCAYVDVAPDPQAGRAKHMLSYTWGYKLAEIASVLQAYCDSRDLSSDSVHVWMCFACINQHRVHEARRNGQTIPFDAFQAEFGERVRSVKHVLAMMSPWRRPMYAERAWCVFEFYTAITEKKDLTILMPSVEQDDFRKALYRGELQTIFEALAHIRIQDAQASVSEDKTNILQTIDPAVGNSSNYNVNQSLPMSKLNKQVREKLQGWFVETAAEHIEARLEHGERVDAMACVSVGKLLNEVVLDYSRARHLLQLCLAFAPVEGEARGLVLAGIGDTHARRYHNEEARRYYFEAKEAFEIGHATRSLTYVELLQAIGALHSQQGDLETARRYFVDAKDSCESLAGLALRSPEYATVLKNIGVSYGEQGDYDTAVRYYLDAEKTYELAGTIQSPHYAGLLLSIGVCRKFQGDHEAWKRYLLEAKGIFEAVGAIWHPSYIATTRSLSECLQSVVADSDALPVEP